jgi:competence protein ComEA
MNILKNLAVRLGITRAEMTSVTILLLFLVIGGAIRYSGSVRDADSLLREAGRARYSEAEVDSLLRLAPGVDIQSAADASESMAAGTDAGEEHSVSSGHPARASKKLFTGVIAFNRASEAQLQQIPGIGPAIAKRLVAFRAERGGNVRQFDDFLDVKGIGKKKLELLKKHLTLE